MKAVLLIIALLSVSFAKETKVQVTTSTQTTLKTHSRKYFMLMTCWVDTQ
jgi:hypothetical protein